MKAPLLAAIGLALSFVSHGMAQGIIVFAGVADAPGPGTREMRLKNVENAETCHVELQPQLTDREIATIEVKDDGEITLEMTFTDKGARTFAEVTKRLVGRRLAIIADGELVSAPVIRHEITGGTAVITGNMTREWAENIAATFKRSKGG